MNKNKTGNTWNELFCVFPFLRVESMHCSFFFYVELMCFPDTFVFLWLNLCIPGGGLDIKRTSGCNISKFDNNGKLNG